MEGRGRINEGRKEKRKIVKDSEKERKLQKSKEGTNEQMKERKKGWKELK